MFELYSLLGQFEHPHFSYQGPFTNSSQYICPVQDSGLEVKLACSPSHYWMLTFVILSVFPGVAIMAILVFLPGYVIKKLRDVQVVTMMRVGYISQHPEVLTKFYASHSWKSDARVQSVTEGEPDQFCKYFVAETYHTLFILAMNVIRMIKFFGWESKVREQIAEKRQEELVLTRKMKLLRILNNNIRYALLGENVFHSRWCWMSSGLISIPTLVTTYAIYVSNCNLGRKI